jgi:hypothetical protein
LQLPEEYPEEFLSESFLANGPGLDRNELFFEIHFENCIVSKHIIRPFKGEKGIFKYKLPIDWLKYSKAEQSTKTGRLTDIRSKLGFGIIDAIDRVKLPLIITSREQLDACLSAVLAVVREVCVRNRLRDILTNDEMFMIREEFEAGFQRAHEKLLRSFEAALPFSIQKDEGSGSENTIIPSEENPIPEGENAFADDANHSVPEPAEAEPLVVAENGGADVIGVDPSSERLLLEQTLRDIESARAVTMEAAQRLMRDRETFDREKEAFAAEKAEVEKEKAVLSSDRAALEGERAEIASLRENLRRESAALLEEQTTLDELHGDLDTQSVRLQAQLELVAQQQETTFLLRQSLERQKSELQDVAALRRELEQRESALQAERAALELDMQALEEAQAAIVADREELESEREAFDAERNESEEGEEGTGPHQSEIRLRTDEPDDAEEGSPQVERGTEKPDMKNESIFAADTPQSVSAAEVSCGDLKKQIVDCLKTLDQTREFVIDLHQAVSNPKRAQKTDITLSQFLRTVQTLFPNRTPAEWATQCQAYKQLISKRNAFLGALTDIAEKWQDKPKASKKPNTFQINLQFAKQVSQDQSILIDETFYTDDEFLPILEKLLSESHIVFDK